MVPDVPKCTCQEHGVPFAPVDSRQELRQSVQYVSYAIIIGLVDWWQGYPMLMTQFFDIEELQTFPGIMATLVTAVTV